MMTENNPFNAKTSGEISIDDMAFFAYHGVHEVEQKIGRDFLVSVYMNYDFETAAVNDDLEATVDYGRVYNRVKNEMHLTERLLETLSRRIGWKLKNDFPKASYIKVQIKKIAPIVGGKAQSATVSYIIGQK